MKRVFLALWLSVAFFSLSAQSEHSYKQFPYAPTVEEQQLLPTWYRNTKSSTPPTGPITALAEFQPMGGVMIAYTDRFGVPVNLISELSFITKVKVLVYPASDSNTVKNRLIAGGVNMDNVQYWVINHDSYWTRDYGPWFIVDGQDRVCAVDFTYNRPSRPHDENALPAVVNKMGIPRYEMPMVHTGGNYMVNGYGTAASTDLVLEENPNQTLASLQTMAHEYLGIDNYMFLNDPLGDYIAHIDCWGKFLSVDKVLIAQVSPTDSRYNDYEDVADVFANSLTPWGNHYQVYRVYAPGNNYCTPYTNSLILNDHVFVPISGTQWDNAAVEVYRQAMPGYTVVSIMKQNTAPWQNTDALHCRTHELADTGMLFIKHFPILGHKNPSDDFLVEADIKPLSGQALVSDSVRVYYRVNDNDWQSVRMNAVNGSQYQVAIPGLQPNDEVDYYIFAKDQSGRRECHPYIGSADPHHFSINPVGIDAYEPVVSLYPNPCADFCILRSEKADVSSVQVFDVCGKQIYSETVNNDVVRLNTSSWVRGIYNVIIRDKKGQNHYKKLVKR